MCECLNSSLNSHTGSELNPRTADHRPSASSGHIDSSSISLHSSSSHLPPSTMDHRPWTIKAFSIIELLAVIAVITILAGFVIYGAGYVQHTMMESRTRVEVRALEAALETYKQDYGAYPPLDPDVKNTLKGWMAGHWPDPKDDYTVHGFVWTAAWMTNSSYVYAALAQNPYNKQYYKFNPKQIQETTPGSGRYMILDPFGNPYGYYPSGVYFPTTKDADYQPPDVNPKTFDLFSSGFNNKEDHIGTGKLKTSDDIGNW